MKSKKMIWLPLAILITLSLFISAHSKNSIQYKIIDLDDISRYNEDRIAFQHIQLDYNIDKIEPTDISIASLLIIQDSKMYLLKDGYDNPNDVRLQKMIFEVENRSIENETIWPNKVDSKPDYIRIMERRIELLQRVDDISAEKKSTEGDNSKNRKTFVSNNFQKLYTNVRNEFLKKHVEIFRSLIINRKESGLIVRRKPFPKKLYLGLRDEPTKYSISVSGQTLDSKIYFAQDEDGDGITETFSVHLPDGFNWGFHSGPNIIFIYKNKDKDLEGIIGKLVSDAYYGTDEEAKEIKDNIAKTLPKEDDTKKIREWMDLLIPTIDEKTKKE